jgi:hypothetical protein
MEDKNQERLSAMYEKRAASSRLLLLGVSCRRTQGTHTRRARGAGQGRAPITGQTVISRGQQAGTRISSRLASSPFGLFQVHLPAQTIDKGLKDSAVHPRADASRCALLAGDTVQ